MSENSSQALSTDTQALIRPEFTSPFDEIGRDEWARLAGETQSPLTEEELAAFRGLGLAFYCVGVEPIIL